MNEKEYLIQNEENGNINISEEVIASIATTAAKEVEGVAGMALGFSAEVAEKFGKKSSTKGVKIVREEDGITISVSLLVKYGCVVRDVAEKAQSAVADAVNSMTGFTVKEVNVNVAGVAFDKE